MALVILVAVVAIVVLLLVGGFLFGLALNLLWWVLIGLFIGALARLIVPGRQAMGWLATAGAGIAGSLLGGIIANAADLGSIAQFLIAVGLAAVIVALLGGTRRGYA